MPTKRYGVNAGNFLTRVIRDKATEILPNRIKRIFYVGSVIGVLFSKNPDQELLDKINTALKVAYGSSSMLFPAYFSDRIWAETVCGKDVIAKLGDLPNSEKWRLSLKFATQCPSWMQYGTEQLMASDVYEAIARVTLKKAA